MSMVTQRLKPEEWEFLVTCKNCGHVQVVPATKETANLETGYTRLICRGCFMGTPMTRDMMRRKPRVDTW